MVYVLATTEDKVRWYKFNSSEPSGFSLQNELDLKVVSAFPSKEGAKCAALLLGLKTWRYVKI